MKCSKLKKKKFNRKKTAPAISEVGIPQILYFGDHGGYAVLIMQMLGPTLNDLREMIGKDKLLEKTIWKIGIQAVNIFFFFIIFYLFIF